ncbi:hypothetical protein RF55_21742 [Lasius niger]|uniref:Uncharacterized protein n=1 Tax=Lasius niger TaxID=67767 RepID=A0A0J7JXP6_LASNI|nr:hypothetical protein RF55_21742 [Lasius niger]
MNPDEKKELRELFGEWSSDEEMASPTAKPALPPTSKPEPPPTIDRPVTPGPPRKTPVSTVQRSDAANRRKMAILLAAPPLPTGRRRSTGTRAPEATPIRQPPANAPRSRSVPTLPRTAATRSTPTTPRKTTVRSTPKPPGLTTVQPPTPTRATPACAATSRPVPTTVREGRPPPPTTIAVAPGVLLAVPHRAIHQFRRYRAWTPEGKWLLRFNQDGSLRSCRLRANAPTTPPPERKREM